MSYTKCVYYQCNKTSRDISLFRFPVNDQDRLILWIRNSGNTFLDSLTNEELSHRYICADHFPSTSIHRGLERSRLIGPAVPVHFLHVEDQCPSPEVLKVKTPSKFYRRRTQTCVEEARSSSASIISMEVPMLTPTRRLSRKCLFEGPEKRLSRKCLFEANEDDSPSTKEIKRSASSLLKKNKAQKAKIRRLRTKMEAQAKMLPREEFRSKVSKTLVTMQHRKEGDKKKWTNDEKNFCLSLFYKSPSTYYFLRRQGVVLAAPSTIRSWLSKSTCSPGLNQDVFKKIQKRFEECSIKDKACVISFDEMSIMTDLQYSNKYDLIEGFEDLGEGRRTRNAAKYALVFLTRGLYKNWKLPVAYFLSHSNVKAENLELLLKLTITKLFDHGLLPKAVVCDQMSTNQKIYRSLGATPKNPFFFCKGRKIFAFFDVPHLIKSIRNNFLHNDYIHENSKISFKDIVKTYEIDRKSEKSRSLIKLTERHMNPNSFQKMNVSLAAQILSNSVSAAIRTAKSTGELQSDTADATANFVQVVNRMFDALNSKNRFNKNPYRHALSKNSIYVRSAIIDGINIFKSIQKISFKTNKQGETKKLLTRPSCFDGTVQSCRAMLQLFDEESTDRTFFYLITSKLNQDILENLFARFRQKGGSNRNPSAKLLRTIFRSNLVNSLIKLPSTKNCQDEVEDGEFLQLNIGQSPQEHIEISQFEQNSSDKCASQCMMVASAPTTEEASCSYSSSNICSSNVITLEECSVNYLAGYLAKSCLDKFNNCKVCTEKLIKENDLDDAKQLIILNKSYNINNIKLKIPSDNLHKLVDSALYCFSTLFEDMAHTTHLKSKLLKAILTFLRCEAEDLLHISCEEHLNYIIDKMISVKINFYCKSKKKNTLERKAHPKLRILNNK